LFSCLAHPLFRFISIGTHVGVNLCFMQVIIGQRRMNLTEFQRKANR